MKRRLLSLCGLSILSSGLAQGQIDLKHNPINLSHGGTGVFATTRLNATSGQFSGYSGLSASPVAQPSDGKLTLRQSYFGGSFSGSIPDYFVGDIIAPPPPFDHDNNPGTPLVVFSPEPVLVADPIDHDGDPDTPPQRPNPPTVVDPFKFADEERLNPPARDFAFPLGYGERYYWSKHAEKVFASESGRLTIYWKSLNRIREEGGANVHYVKKETYTVSAGAARNPVRMYWTESRFKGPWIDIAGQTGGTVQEVVVAYNTQVPERVSEEEIYQPEGGTGLGPGQEIPLPDRTLWYDFNQGLLKAYNKEGRILVEYLGQPRDQSDPSLREHLGIEIVDIIQEARPEQLQVYLGERLLPTNGRESADAEASSPDGKSLLRPEEFTVRPVNSGGALTDEFVAPHQIGGRQAFYAVKENDFANQVQSFWMKPSATGNLGVEWPEFLNSYRITWPNKIDGFFALNARPTNQALVQPTAFQLPADKSPTLVYQDDESGQEAQINPSSQLEINFQTDSDDENRSLVLLRSDVDDFWYLRVYSYLEDNVDDLRDLDRTTLAAEVDLLESQLASAQAALDALDEDDPNYDNALTTRNRFRDAFQRADRLLYRYDNFLPYHVRGTVAVGERLQPPAQADSVAGYISAGDAHNPGAYIDPTATSVPEAEKGAIIPVNARKDHDHLMVWWYKRIDPPSDAFDPIYVPSIVGEYDLVWPGEAGTTEADEIVLAANEGTGDLPPAQQGATLYAQNNPNAAGYNPNEEHAQRLGSRFYALRDDLAVYSGDEVISSRPYVLLDYTDPVDQRPSMRAFQVLREKDTNGDGDLNDPEDKTFRYPIVLEREGKPLQAPQPLAIMSVPLHEGSSANREITPVNIDPASNIPGTGLPEGDPTTGQDDLQHYNRFTFEDRNGQKWIYRGPHNPNRFNDGNLNNDPALSMQYYYQTLEDFDFPDATGADAAPEVGTIVPYLRPYRIPGNPASGFDPANAPDSLAGTPLTVRYIPLWPDDPRLPAEDRAVLAPLNYAQTLTGTKDGLPQITGNTSLRFLYQQSIASNVTVGTPSAVLHDPTAKKRYFFGNGLDAIPAAIPTTDARGKTYFQNLPPHLQERFYFDPLEGTQGALVLEGRFEEEGASEPFLFPNVLSSDDVSHTKDDVALLKALVPVGSSDEVSWHRAVDNLSLTLETFRPDPEIVGGHPFKADSSLDRSVGGTELASISDEETPTDSFALTAVGGGSGYVTLIAQNDQRKTPEGNPVAVHILKVGGGLHQGEVVPLKPTNPLSEQLTLQHTADFGGDAFAYEFEWRYTPPVNGRRPQIPGHPDAPSWLPLEKQIGSNRTVFGGGAQPLLTLSDNYVTMRYRPLDPSHAGYKGNGSADAHWSEWTAPALAEGWIKRVLAGINPFNQRLSDFFNNAVDTDISLLTQAGSRFEGNVALTLDNIQDVGLLGIYETVLNRGISFSIDGAPAVDYGPANDALLLAAGYISDLYQVIGDEAFADAANPMILFDTQSIGLVADTSLSQGFDEFFRETATSRFAFEGQVPSLIDEELVLLRGRDDSQAPGVESAPIYNRFFWNYTRGIDAGEVLYALNYNIRERQEEEADGKIDATDARRAFPQGHGDAYGHYLMSLKGYYRLLTDPQFSWAPRIEAVNVLGQPVAIDYLDERKFAQAAVKLGRTADQILDLERRKSFQEDTTEGWSHLRDQRTAEAPRVAPGFGVDGTASRAAQGSYYHWIVGNALLPDEDTVNSGIQKIDRTTVPELDELALLADTFQRHADEANLAVNPLGLNSNSTLFDISPSELAAGKTHYEQIFDRAVSSLGNAFDVFDRARESTELLRGLQNQSEEFATAVFDQERSFTRQLQDLYGTPYPGDVGPGKFYDQGYSGDDFKRFMYIDQPYTFEDPRAEEEVTIDLIVPGEFEDYTRTFSPNNPAELAPKEFSVEDDRVHSYTIQPNRLVQFATPEMGRRATTGKIQDALLGVTMARTKLETTLGDHGDLRNEFQRELQLFNQTVQSFTAAQHEFDAVKQTVFDLEQAVAAMESAAFALDATADIIDFTDDGGRDAFPRTIGLSSDPSFGARAVSFASMLLGYGGAKLSSAATQTVGANLAPQIEKRQFEFDKKLEALGFGPERARMVWELEQAYSAAISHQGTVDQAVKEYTQSLQRYQTLAAEALRIQAEREIFRKRAAAIAQGYRTRDVAFRTFRTEALEQYQGLLDWAAKYTYLSAKAYDYETGLLAKEAGRDFLNKIVQTRSLGLLDSDGNPQFAGADTGDAGLSGLLKQLDGDWSVVKGRLGFNNPDTQGTTFSLRREEFRLATGEDANHDWKQKLEAAVVPDLRADSDIAAHALQIEGSAVPIPGIVLTFETMVQPGKNFFGKALQAGDHAFSASSFAHKIHSVGVVFKDYKGMDPCLVCQLTGPGPVTSDHPDALSATPYVYLIPVGEDIMRTPPLGDESGLRAWNVHDHALPLPFNIGDSAFSDIDYWNGASSLTEPFFHPRKHQAFRAVDNPEFFFSDHPEDFTNSRLVGRSVWNTKWKLVIPGNGLLADPIEGLDKFLRSVNDIQLYLKTYSYAGN